jgi:hypothetical protein
MSNPTPSGPLHQRLGEQLQALSQVSETLTIRLLELEERLLGVERRYEQWVADAHGEGESTPGATSAILDLTEERIARLEELLVAAPFASSRSTPSVLPFPSGVDHGSSGALLEGEFAGDPFPQEEEQYFMDELSA